MLLNSPKQIILKLWMTSGTMNDRDLHDLVVGLVIYAAVFYAAFHMVLTSRGMV